MKHVGFFGGNDNPPEPPPRKRKKFLLATSVLSILAVITLITVSAPSDNSSRRSPVLSTVEIAKRGTDSVLRIFTEDPRYKVGGSAIQVASRVLVTNFHVVQKHIDNGWELYAHSEEWEKIPLEVVAYYRAEDLAVLRADQDLPGSIAVFANPILLEYDMPIPRGSLVYAIGFPGAADRLGGEDGESSFLRGMASRSFQASAWQDEHPLPPVEPFWIIQHTAPTNPGNSGGSLLNICGEVVGITTQREARMIRGPGGIPLVSDPIQGIFFALDAGTVTKLLSLADVESKQSPTRCAPWTK